MASNYTWCREHQTPDSLDPAFISNQRRSLYQFWVSINDTDPSFFGGNNKWNERRWSKATFWALPFLSLSLFLFLLYYDATKMSMPTHLSTYYPYLVDLDFDEKGFGAAALTVMLLTPFLGAIQMALLQPRFEDYVFYGVAAMMLASGFVGSCLIFLFSPANYLSLPLRHPSGCSL